jgi:S-adenosylmethionine decarboxylase
MVNTPPPIEDGGFRYWVASNGQRYAGRHLLIDFWGAQKLDQIETVRNAILQGINACGANLLDLTLYQFTPNGGITGAAVLSQSHLCIHTWPEEGFAAIDLFICGLTDPTLILPSLQEAFSPGRVEIHELKRGFERLTGEGEQV